MILSSQKKNKYPEVLAYLIQKIPTGFALMAGTSSGLLYLFLGPSPEYLKTVLKKTAPYIILQPVEDLDKKCGAIWSRALTDYFEKKTPTVHLPLQMQGTNFQREVWMYLQKIPFGSKLSYKELAINLGRPTAIRAVANACAKNNLALAIPCHRVIKSSGELSGYRWGKKIKNDLLQFESS